MPTVMSDFNDCLFLTGPTASGKTALALRLSAGVGEALGQGVEIVGMDSMTVYRGMDIGTAKPSAAERAAVPHHLIDCVEPHRDCSVAWYCEAALQAVDDIRSRGAVPLFVGGTPLYLKALLRGLFEGPPANSDVRERIRAESARVGMEAMHARLAEVDPDAAARIHRNDLKRIERALEVYEATGRPISTFQTQFDAGPTDALVWCLTLERELLNRRINARVKWMFEAGLVDEVRGLLAADPPMGDTARQALGYKQVIEFLDGRYDEEKCIEHIKRGTRRLAKRQMTWFRRLEEVRWVRVEEGDAAEQLAEPLVAEAVEYLSRAQADHGGNAQQRGHDPTNQAE